MSPQIGDNFWIRSDGRMYFGEVTGTTPGGQKFVLKFTNEIPKISGLRRREIHVTLNRLRDRETSGARWELLNDEALNEDEKVQPRLLRL